MERGWNDPPEFLYTAESATSTPPRKNVLNKRVAYPMKSTTSISGQCHRLELCIAEIGKTATMVLVTNLQGGFYI